MRSARIFLITFLFLFFCKAIAQTNYTAYVNPFIGTGGHGHTFPGAVLPFGMVQLSPDTRVDGSWDGSSGYHYSDTRIYGFSHTHLSGTGCSDWGDVLLMPTVGRPSLQNTDYASAFEHKNEKASPGFYEVLLDRHAVKAELTVTPRVGIHRYTFPKTKEANIILDLLHRDKTLGCTIIIKDSVTVIGFRTSEAWAKKQVVYFEIKFSQPFKKAELGSNQKFVERLGKSQRAEGAYFQFDLSDGKPLLVKVAISSTGVEGAAKNLQVEAPHWNFERYKNEAQEIWNKQLQKIEVKDIDKNKLTVFYTALYHCSIHPSLYMDVDNQYRGSDNRVHTAEGFTNYSVFSLWDTYRALNPLFTIIEKKRSADFINSFLNHYRQSGRLPVWELSNNETDCMIGFHSVSVIADAMAKGIRGFDTTLMYEAVKAASNYSAFSVPVFNKNGFLQVDDENESVSKTLEYAYDDWCIAQIAKQMNRPDDAALYLKRSQAYKNVFDVSTGFMRPRKNGGWLTPFYPAEINNYFTEGNSWQYSFYVPHDLDGLIKLHGGKENFEKKLDELFTTSEKASGRDLSDVTGLIGQYAHGNEPSHHMAYLYDFIGKPQKTSTRTQQICREFYKNTPDGLIGNEDCGQMSAWYVFSAMGLYPVCPGSAQYSLTEPVFKNVTLNPESGKPFLITANAAPGQVVSGISLNGVASANCYIDHTAVLNGGTLSFMYAAAGSENKYGKQRNNAARSSVEGEDIIPVAIITAPSRVFKNNVQISIMPINTGPVTCAYTTDGSEPTLSSRVYTQPFSVDSDAVVKVKAFLGKEESHSAEAHFFKLKYNYDVKIRSKVHAQYAAEGAQTLIDNIKGDVQWRKGGWLGYQAQDFECVVNLEQKKTLHFLSLNCLQDTRAWIVYPTEVSFYASDDNKTYSLVETIHNTISAEDYQLQSRDFSIQLAAPLTTRYIKITAKNYGTLPEWHEGKNGEAYIFVDELEIK